MTIARPGKAGLTLFASADFACNLYWQSISFFLLFFYTDFLGLTPGMAGFIYMIGSIWAGVADLLVGMAAQRSRRGYRWFVLVGALPLGLTFVSLYAFPPLAGAALAAFALVAHLLFRTFYAFVNVPYSALSARISDDSGDRATVSGLRMLFGTAASIVVAFGSVGGLLGRGSSGSFLLSAIVFALVGSAILIAVAAIGPREAERVSSTPAPSILACIRVLAANRAFVTLNLATAAVGIAASLFTRSVLYYFTYIVGDAAAGPPALAVMGVAGAIFVPAWMVIGHRIGVRATWLVSAALGIVSLGMFAVAGASEGWRAQLFLVPVQAALIGFNFAYWAMLPDTVEYGEHRSGVRVEAMAFGVSALLQKIVLGVAAGAMGLAYEAVGYVANATQSAGALAGMRWIMFGAPAAAIALSVAAMLANPLRRTTHAEIVADLAKR
jgi:GPH family glycoside/pentoside/hexuronide:cation symporter